MSENAARTLSSPNAEKFIQQYFMDLSATRMRKHCTSLQFTTSQLEKYDKSEVLGDEISMISLWGEVGAMVFKTHYKTDFARAVAGKALNQAADQVQEDTYRAYMNEFSNLLGGYFRGILEGEKVLVGMSLPFTARGSDEVCFYKIRDPRYFYSKWNLVSSEGHAFVCSSEILLMDPKLLMSVEGALKTALELDQVDGNSGDIEFF